VKTLRLLLWLRWRIGMNTSSRGGRWVAAIVVGLLALALSPLYLGGAVAAWKGARDLGAPALLITFGVVQVVIVWISLLTGAMGRLFELDKLKRYPLHPGLVYLVNVLAAMGEPIVLLCVPALVGGVIGVAQHDGAFAAAAAALGSALLLFVTLAWVQLLLAVLDDLLRREWMRYVAGFGLSLTILGLQMFMSQASHRLSESVHGDGIETDRMLAIAREVFAALPGVAAPAAVAGARPEGLFTNGAVGLLATIVLVSVPLALGVRLMTRASLRPAVLTPVRDRRASERGLALPVPGLTRVQGLLLGRELVYLTRTPALLFQMAIVPITVIGLSFLRPTSASQAPAFLPMFILVSGLAGRNLMLWSHDGPGVRTLFLMPLRTRDLVLSKALAWLVTVGAEATVVFVALSLHRGAAFTRDLPVLVPGYLAIAFVAAMIGLAISIRRPTKPPAQGMGRRNPDAVGGLLGLVAVLAAVGVLFGLVAAVRAITPDPWDRAASTVLTSSAMLLTGLVAWIAIDRFADLMERNRESMIDVLAKSADA
jgi:hypothetical protein